MLKFEKKKKSVAKRLTHVSFDVCQYYLNELLYLTSSNTLWYHFWRFRNAIFLSDAKRVLCHLELFVGGTRYENSLQHQIWLRFLGPIQAKLIF